MPSFRPLALNNPTQHASFAAKTSAQSGTKSKSVTGLHWQEHAIAALCYADGLGIGVLPSALDEFAANSGAC